MSIIPDPILIWPTQGNYRLIESMSFDLISVNLNSVATLSNEVIPGGTVDQRFVARITFGPKTELEGRYQSGLISRLRGIRGRLRIGDRARRLPAYNINVLTELYGWTDGTLWDDSTGWLDNFVPPLVAVREAAAQGRDTTVLQGYPASKTGVSQSGDLIEFRPNGKAASHSFIHEITHISNSDANGYTRVYFQPGLRAGVAPSDQCVLKDATGVFRLADDSQGISQRSGDGMWRLGVSLVEVPIPLPGVEFGQ